MVKLKGNAFDSVYYVSLISLSPMIADSLKFSSAVSVSLAVVFVVIIAGITIVKLVRGDISMPILLPNVVDQASFWKLFTVVPVIVTAYICHYNGNNACHFL